MNRIGGSEERCDVKRGILIPAADEKKGLGKKNDNETRCENRRKDIKGLSFGWRTKPVLW